MQKRLELSKSHSWWGCGGGWGVVKIQPSQKIMIRIQQRPLPYALCGRDNNLTWQKKPQCKWQISAHASARFCHEKPSLIILDPSIHVSIILGLAVTFLVAFSMMMMMMVMIGNDDESDDHWWWWWWLGSSAWIRQPAGREGSQFKGKVCPWFPSRNQRPKHIWSSSSFFCLSIYLAEYCVPKIQYKIMPVFNKNKVLGSEQNWWLLTL